MKYKETTCFINLKQQTQEKGELQFEKNCKDIKLFLISLQFFRIVATNLAAVTQTF